MFHLSGDYHTRRALTEPIYCTSCRQLQHSTLERQVTFTEKVLGYTTIAWHEHLLSRSRDWVWCQGAFGWKELTEYDLRALALELAPCHDDDDVLDIGLYIQGLSENSRRLYHQASTPLLLWRQAAWMISFSPYYCAAEKLAQKHSSYLDMDSICQPSAYAAIWPHPSTLVWVAPQPSHPSTAGSVHLSWKDLLSTGRHCPFAALVHCVCPHLTELGTQMPSTVQWHLFSMKSKLPWIIFSRCPAVYHSPWAGINSGGTKMLWVETGIFIRTSQGLL